MNSEFKPGDLIIGKWSEYGMYMFRNTPGARGVRDISVFVEGNIMSTVISADIINKRRHPAPMLFALNELGMGWVYQNDVRKL